MPSSRPWIRGQQDVDSTLTALNGEAVQRIHAGLEGTDTAVAFDEKISELITQPGRGAAGVRGARHLRRELPREVPRGRPAQAAARADRSTVPHASAGPGAERAGPCHVFSRTARSQ